MRLDKFLAEAGLGSRSEVKKWLKDKQITVNGEVETSPKRQVISTDQIFAAQKPLKLKGLVYYLLYKPQNVITATKDQSQRTVLDLIKPSDYVKDLAPVGRLDKDTTGLLLLTNDGQLAHDLLAPKKHVAKTYWAKISGVMTKADADAFLHPLTLKNGEVTKPAHLEILAADEKEAYSEVLITITEGKYHQVKRMVASRGKKVVALKRIKMGALTLDSTLKPGEYRPLTESEIAKLKGR